jgi:cytoskeletal protein RodZ
MRHIILILLLFPLAVGAQEVRLAWDASPSPGVHYRLYAGTNSVQGLTNALVVVNAETNLTATVEISQAQQWYFVATAFDPSTGLESEPTNEVMVETPAAPANMRTIHVEHTIAITNGWNDVGFFRLKIQ